ncbi:MAG: hypothetical protein F4W90_11625 [Gammaproteobacteria bacterium]|nr:hypothetical protein [Gammaproteobacteria bacterium]
MRQTPEVYAMTQANQVLKCFTVVAIRRALQVKYSFRYAYWQQERVRLPVRVLQQKDPTLHADCRGTEKVNRIAYGISCEIQTSGGSATLV